MSKGKTHQNALNTLSAEQQQLLKKVQRFLLNVTDPTIIRLVRLHGYNNAEHDQGNHLYIEASGMKLPLDAFISAQAQAQISDDDLSPTLFRELDQFENKWLPRVQSALKRFIAPDAYAQFIAAFFQDLSQQPEGPAVVGSVTKLLDRTQALATSAVAGASAAFASLVKRGLDDDTQAHIRDLLNRVQRLRPAAPPTTPPLDTSALALAQQEAYGQLNNWYQDWATTLRQELDHRSLVRLGLRASKPKKGSDDDATSPDDAAL